MTAPGISLLEVFLLNGLVSVLHCTLISYCSASEKIGYSRVACFVTVLLYCISANSRFVLALNCISEGEQYGGGRASEAYHSNSGMASVS